MVATPPRERTRGPWWSWPLALTAAALLVVLTGWLVTRGALDPIPAGLAPTSEGAPDPATQPRLQAPDPAAPAGTPAARQHTPLGFRTDPAAVTTSPPPAPVVLPPEAGGEAQQPGAAPTDGQVVTDPAALANGQSQALVGRPVLLSDARVVERMGPRVVRVRLADAPAREAATAVVVLPTRAPQLEIGDAVRVRGSVQHVPADLAETRGLPQGLVVLATEVRAVD